nr:hypothetical protein [Lachnospiraceae bacterium]
PELQGRISKTVILNGFTEQDYKNIMLSKTYSPIKRVGENNGGIDIKISRARAERIASEAYHSKKGVRAMNNAVESYVNDILFDKPNTKYIYME